MIRHKSIKATQSIFAGELIQRKNQFSAKIKASQLFKSYSKKC